MLLGHGFKRNQARVLVVILTFASHWVASKLDKLGLDGLELALHDLERLELAQL